MGREACRNRSPTRPLGMAVSVCLGPGSGQGLSAKCYQQWAPASEPTAGPAQAWGEGYGGGSHLDNPAGDRNGDNRT